MPAGQHCVSCDPISHPVDGSNWKYVNENDYIVNVSTVKHVIGNQRDEKPRKGGLEKETLLFVSIQFKGA